VIAAGGADLHIHTTHSDGACSPCQVVVAAANVGLRALAITDHDTLSALEIARPEARRWGIELVPGVELSCDHDGREVHILGHFIRDDDPALRAATDRLRAGRWARLEAMAARLAELGLSVDLEAVRRHHPRAVLGRRHLAEYLARTGQITSPREAFARYLGDSGPAAMPKVRLPWAEAIGLIQGACGVASLAHPPFYLRFEMLERMVAAGLRGIEVEGPGISRSLERRWRAWADRLDLVPTAGTDFHAPDRPGRGGWIGAIATPPESLERLRGLSLDTSRRAAGSIS
jgi:predicted metal-dependent phosphoesterase TrpH